MSTNNFQKCVNINQLAHNYFYYKPNYNTTEVAQLTLVFQSL